MRKDCETFPTFTGRVARFPAAPGRCVHEFHKFETFINEN